MRYVIESIEYVQDSDNQYYVVANFYEPGDGNISSITNDFIIYLPPEIDEAKRIDEVARTFFNRALVKGYSGNMTNAHAFSRMAEDPRGLIKRPDISGLIGVRQ